MDVKVMDVKPRFFNRGFLYCVGRCRLVRRDFRSRGKIECGNKKGEGTVFWVGVRVRSPFGVLVVWKIELFACLLRRSSIVKGFNNCFVRAGKHAEEKRLFLFTKSLWTLFFKPVKLLEKKGALCEVCTGICTICRPAE